MRLAFVNSAWPPGWGGGEKWTVEAAEWFLRRGDDVCVIGRPQSKLIGAARGRQLPVIEYRFGGDFDPFAMMKARALLSEAKAEMVVVNFNKEAWQFGLAARKLRLPVVARHGFPLLRSTMHHRTLARRILTRLVVNASSIREGYAQMGFDVSNVAVIHNGVRTIPQRTGELRQRFSVADGVPLIVAAGRIESQKRFDRVLQIAQDLLPVHPGLKVLIAGEGPLRASLTDDVATRGLSDCIQFTGFIPDLAEIIGDASLFLLTSDDEGTPNVVLEAMAARVACIAFAVGAVPEIFAGALSANAIAPADTTSMSARAGYLLANDEARRDTANRMFLRVQEEFSFDQSMRAFAELFHTVLSRKL